MEEIWKPVPSCPGMMASSLGYIKLPEKVGVMPNGGTRLYLTKPVLGVKLRSSKTARHEYYGVRTRDFGQKKVHRLVCEAFYGPEPFLGAVVIHLDENALNNRPENLRWGTQKENLSAEGFKEYCRGRTGDNSPWAKHKRKASDVSRATIS